MKCHNYYQGVIDTLTRIKELNLLKETEVDFHGYTICYDGTILSKKGKPLKSHKNFRRGGNFDMKVVLYIRGKRVNYVVQRLVGMAFFGPIDFYEMNHKKRDTTKNGVADLEKLIPSDNQKHWRKIDRTK